MLLHQNRRDFLDSCRNVIDALGKKTDVVILGKELKGKLYEDTVIYIAMSDDEKHMEVERKMYNSPVIYIQNDEVIHFHSEFIYLTEHIDKILRKSAK